MESIQHRIIETNGIKMHIAEKGSGPLVLLLHGFPELWYSWRHQILALADSGYHAVAPDLRGYGDTDAPQGVDNYTCFHMVGDLIGLLNALGEEQVFVAGHDWGALIAWYLCLLRPDRVKALVNLSVQFPPRNPSIKPVDLMRKAFGDDYYICRFQELGKAETEFADTEKTVRNFLTYRKPGAPTVRDGQLFGGRSVTDTLPAWLSEEEVRYYVDKFRKSGFTGGLNYYRNLNRNWELLAPWQGSKVMVPTKFVVGDEDAIYTTPGAKEYIHGGRFKSDVPLLEEIVMIEGAGHFLTQERSNEVSQHILDFISFVVGHDWAAVIAWYLCLPRPDRVKALVNPSVQFTSRNPDIKPVDLMRKALGDGYYIWRFQEPGLAEAEFADSLILRKP